jgi:hypothetical protein
VRPSADRSASISSLRWGTVFFFRSRRHRGSRSLRPRLEIGKHEDSDQSSGPFYRQGDARSGSVRRHGYFWLSSDLGVRSGVPLALEVEASRGPRVFQITERTGAVVRTLAVPNLLRPRGAANNGLYLARSGSIGGIGTGLIFYFGSDANSVNQVFTVPGGSQAGGYYPASWLLAEGNAVWSDICNRASRR